MQIETLDRRTMTEPDARAIATLLDDIWPKAGRTVDSRTADLLNNWRDYRGPETAYPRSFVVQEAGRVIAHAGADPRTIGTTQGDMTILALARVCTDPTVRGRGLGQAVVQAAFDLVDQHAFAFALFQTNENVRPFYENLGAVTATNKFVNSLAEEPTKNPFWDTVIMRYPSTAGWPEGEIDLRGPGF